MRRLRLMPFVVQEAGPHFRAGRTFALRAFYLAVSGAALAVAYETVRGGESGALVRNLYQTFYFTSYIAVCLLAPVLAARAVFRDKVSGLASVIASAPLTPSDYVLGRLLGQVAGLLAILAVGIPLFITLVFLHAATPLEVLKGLALLALGGVLSTSLALGRAIESESLPGAVLSTYVLSLFPGCLTPLFWLPVFATDIDVPAWAWVYLVMAVPVTLAYNLFRARLLYRRCFVSESLTLPPWQLAQRGYRGPIRGNPVRWWEATRARRFLERNFGQADSLSAAVRILSGLAVAASLIPLCLHPVGVGLLFALGALAATAQASASIAGDREQKVFETLVSTALTPRAIVYGKLLGLVSGLKLVWLASALGLGVHLAFALLEDRLKAGELLVWAAGELSAALLLVGLALHASCASPSPAKAMTRTLLFGFLAVAPPFLAQSSWRLPGGFWILVILVWAGLGLVLIASLPARFARAAA